MVRAIAIAARLEYRRVYKAMADAMHAAGYPRSGDAYRVKRPRAGVKARKRSRTVQDDVMRLFGFEKVRLPKGPRPTYTEAHEEHGDCVVSTNKHYAAIAGGCLRDTHDGRSYEWWSDPDENGLSRIVDRERKAQAIWVRREG